MKVQRIALMAAEAMKKPGTRVALVVPKEEDAFVALSDLLAILKASERRTESEPSLGRAWEVETESLVCVFTLGRLDRMRGRQFHICFGVAPWQWDQVEHAKVGLSIRLGEDPRIVFAAEPRKVVEWKP